jgi:hypothetical protein
MAGCFTLGQAELGRKWAFPRRSLGTRVRKFWWHRRLAGAGTGWKACATGKNSLPLDGGGSGRGWQSISTPPPPNPLPPRAGEQRVAGPGARPGNEKDLNVAASFSLRRLKPAATRNLWRQETSKRRKPENRRQPFLKIIINGLTKCCFFPNFFKMDLKQKTGN